ncbi:hypothetical protein DERP_012634 [Dermatophagoides pteronyssinus]|uniref:Transmembrane protein 127 transmembrane region domain-containing protein n=1 Tax=Dermatophagoides pteronyssinus TaxID=6956 RepID=A0ABQ8IYI1_DERPT|nr:hypothetical protein DERP_012634 [Dermatophagoides pteronyssinus]
MLELRPEFTRFYQEVSERFNSGLNNIRSFGQQITTRFQQQEEDNSMVNQSTAATSSSDNPFLDSDENLPNNNNNSNDLLNPECPTTNHSTRSLSSNNTHRKFLKILILFSECFFSGFPGSNRRSSRHHHRQHHSNSNSQSTTLCRDRDNYRHHQTYHHPYLFNNGNNTNSNSYSNNVGIIHRNGMITVRSFNNHRSYLNVDNHHHNNDRNVLAAILSIIVIAILATALVQPKWFSIYNDLCVPTTTATSAGQRYYSKSDNSIDTPPSTTTNIDDNSISPSLSIFDFQQSSSSSNPNTQYRPQYYYNGPFHSSSSYSSTYSLIPVTIYGLTPDFKSCANAQILALKRTIIGLCFLAIMSTLVQFFLDTMGSGGRKWMNLLRQYAMGNILCVLFCVLIIGICYFISVLYERVQLQQLFNATRMSHHHHQQQQQPNAIWFKNRMISHYLTIHQIEVKFELSYYLITLAGFLSILASAANLFRRPRQIFIERINGLNNNNHNDYDDCNGYYPHYYPNHHTNNNRSLMARHLRSSTTTTAATNVNNNNNGDENSLLNSDVLMMNNSLESPTTTTATILPYSFANDWSHYCNQNHQSSTQRSTMILPPPIPPSMIPQSSSTSSSCPPPPPYSP